MTLKEANEHNLDDSRDRRIGGGCKQEDSDISRFVAVSFFLYTKVTECVSVFSFGKLDIVNGLMNHSQS